GAPRKNPDRPSRRNAGPSRDGRARSFRSLCAWALCSEIASAIMEAATASASGAACFDRDAIPLVRLGSKAPARAAALRAFGPHLEEQKRVLLGTLRPLRQVGIRAPSAKASKFELTAYPMGS